jgi:quinone-modifying oxidoreductase subunit QmoA
MRGRTLVVGGGISGMTAAIQASEAGCEVVLVEKNSYLGGRVVQMSKYFPKLCPPICGHEINVRRIRSNRKIRCLTLAEVERITGDPGNYRVTIRVRPRGVNEKCTACGDCAEVCPVERANAFNWGMDRTKGIYLPFDAAYPPRFVIDAEACLGDSCRKCVEACKYDAIDLNDKWTVEEIEVAAVIFATGWQPYDAVRIENLGFGRYPNIVTNMMMERLASATGPTEGKITRPSDGQEIESIAFVQCAGSRDENHLKHCSGVCCMASLKQARYVREQYPEARVYVFYIDVRAPGRLEDFYADLQKDEKISFIKGKVAKIEEDAASQDLVVEAEDIIGGGRVTRKVGMVVLATGLVPSEIGGEIGSGLKRDEHGFLLPQQDQSGLIAVGCAKRPIDVAACVRDATGAALKALQIVCEEDQWSKKENSLSTSARAVKSAAR